MVVKLRRFDDSFFGLWMIDFVWRPQKARFSAPDGIDQEAHPITKSFELHHSMLGKPRAPLLDHRSLPLNFSIAKFM